jgi:EAL domain-containing protein (putative c-di-GMP-specific phosphodiesterase class I)
VDPSLIKFEITESQIMRSKEENIKGLNKIRDLGIGIILDDFGIGYSSLNYITRFPIDEVKIDKSFIDLMGKNDKICAVIDTIIYLCRKLRLKVTAEGVEIKEQFELLKKMSCDKIQGYYVSKSLPMKELEKFINNYKKLGKEKGLRDTG